MSDYDRHTVIAAAKVHTFGKLPAGVLAICTVLGIGAFLFGVYGEMAQRAWQAYLVNLVFWIGLTCGVVMFSAVQIITKANWGRSIKRLAEAPVFFLPVAFVLFWVLYIGKDYLFPWIHEPIPEKARWLSTGFFFLRDGAALFLLAAAAIGMIYHSVRGDIQMLSSDPDRFDVAVGVKHGRSQTVYANLFGIGFGVLLSLLAFDLIMSLNPHWYSTLFGAYYFVGSFFTGLAALNILCFIAAKYWGMHSFIKPFHLHNLGKLLLGFCLITADFFYVQFLLAWYGNLPEETGFVLQRVRGLPWEPLAWTVLTVCFALPFVILISRRVKMKHGLMVILCSVILAGMWLERFILVAPSIWKGDRLPLGFLEILISIGFFGIVGLCVLLFLGRYPLLPVSDPLFWKGLER